MSKITIYHSFCKAIVMLSNSFPKVIFTLFLQMQVPITPNNNPNARAIINVLISKLFILDTAFLWDTNNMYL